MLLEGGGGWLVATSPTRLDGWMKCGWGCVLFYRLDLCVSFVITEDGIGRWEKSGDLL